jgi:hypothetical protein
VTPVREHFLSLINDLDGLQTDDTRYADLIRDPSAYDSDARTRELTRMSGCALTVRGVWRRLGITHPILMLPYRDRKAVSDLFAIARPARALKGWGQVKPGDVVLVAEPEHVWTVIDAPGYLGLVKGLDGGQPHIAVKWHEINGTPAQDGARVVKAVIDLDRVWTMFGGK